MAATAASQFEQISIDGKWIPCLPAEEFGFLGSRYICNLGKTSGQPSKKLLLRNCIFSEENQEPLRLELQPVQDGIPILKAISKEYAHATPKGNGRFRKTSSGFYQQNITNYISLKRAVLKLLIDGNQKGIWTLYYACCDALKEFGKNWGEKEHIPLQFPASLAVGTNGKVIPLDGQFRVPRFASTSETSNQFRSFFGDNGEAGYATSLKEASLLHSKALLQYFRQLIHESKSERVPVLELVSNLERIPPGQDLKQVQAWIEENVEDWSVPTQDFVSNEPEPILDTLDVMPEFDANPILEGIPPERKKGHFLVIAMSLLILLLSGVVGYLLLNRSVAGTGDPRTIDTSLLFSSYCVVFPDQGTSNEKVQRILLEMFGDRLLRTDVGNSDFLDESLKTLIKALDQPEKIKDLLQRLSKVHSVRFKGYNSESNDTLVKILERGGVFTILSDGKVEHGSLLQFTGLEKVMKQGSVPDQAGSQKLLEVLKKAVAEYASLKDVLTVVGKRSAFIIKVEPSAKAHEELRKKLLSRLDAPPVFIPRPVFELFDAVDPFEDDGGGKAFYTLKLGRQSYWRQPSLEDRAKIDYAANTNSNRMKWQKFDPEAPISWKQISVTKTNGKTNAVSTFDIAVVVQDKVVVFRNQSIMVGDTKDQVVAQTKSYVEKVLNLKIQPIEDAVRIRDQQGQYTGTLSYSSLAEQVSSNVSGEDLQVLSNQEFLALRSKEDGF